MKITLLPLASIALVAADDRLPRFRVAEPLHPPAIQSLFDSMDGHDMWRELRELSLSLPEELSLPMLQSMPSMILSMPTRVPTSPTPTTLPPSTVAPTTPSPTTPSPTTLPPTTMAPTTLAPTTMAPTTLPPTTPEPTIQSCHSVYAYLPNRSTCFTNYSASAWGWSIDLDGVDLPIEIPLYASAGGCDISRGFRVGSLNVQETAMTYELDDGFGGKDFHVYSGICPVSDGGAQATTGTCDVSLMAQRARTNGQYPLTAGEYIPLLPTFTFDDSTDVYDNWETSYDVFPLNRRYLSAHATVCTCRGLTCSDVAPTRAPTVSSAAGAIEGERSAPSGGSSGLGRGGTIGVVALAIVAVAGVGLWASRRRQRTRASASSSQGSVSTEAGASAV